MSGIIAILNTDGRPVDGDLLERATQFLAFRGPDGQGTWQDGPIGLGCALLHTRSDVQPQAQPLHLEPDCRIVADVRLDDRKRLLQALQPLSREDLRFASDAKLLLHAYRAWGESCVDRLLGDFAFIIWDGTNRKLFCARDHFGVKPLYYAQLGDVFLAGNTLKCLRLHPDVSPALNDQAIADFLMFGHNQDPHTTSFGDIQRLPPGHVLVVERGQAKIRRYWSMPLAVNERRESPSDVLEGFQELWKIAIRDRMDCERIGVFMGGGLDSTSIAATAKQLLEGADSELCAYTQGYYQLIPDEEPGFAGLTAEALSIPIEYFRCDDFRLFERMDDLQTPEPVDMSQGAILLAMYESMAGRSRVVLTGYGGDAMLHPESFYFAKLMVRLKFGRFLADAWRHYWSHGRKAPLNLRSWVRQGTSNSRGPGLPSWLNPHLIRRLGLEQRWYATRQEPQSLHAFRPKAYAFLNWALWPFLFHTHNAEVTGFPLEFRHPFFDVRLVSFLFSLPSVPWFMDKWILRESMRGLLPERVRVRPKAPLPCDPVKILLSQEASAWIDHFQATEALDHYVIRGEVPMLTGADQGDLDVDLNLRPLILDSWLRSSLTVSQPQVGVPI